MARILWRRLLRAPGSQGNTLGVQETFWKLAGARLAKQSGRQSQLGLSALPKPGSFSGTGVGVVAEPGKKPSLIKKGSKDSEGSEPWHPAPRLGPAQACQWVENEKTCWSQDLIIIS